MSPVVSVILPFRNAESTLGTAISSILNQTFTDFELLLIDNDSSDKSVTISSKFIEDTRVRMLTESQIGVVHATNKGISEAKGKYIARMDADDWSFPDRLATQVQELENDAELGLISGMVQSMSTPTEGLKRYLGWINEVISTEEIRLNQFVEFPIVNPSIMLRHELFAKVGIYSEGDFPEDYEFFLRLSQEQVKMSKVNLPVLKWNDLPSRLTRTHPSYSEESFNNIKSQYLAKWLKSNNPDHPSVWIWGAGKKARTRSTDLLRHGIEIKGYIDINQKENSQGLPVTHFERLPKKPNRFIISYVSNWGARNEIKSYLINKGWIEGVNFILAG